VAGAAAESLAAPNAVSVAGSSGPFVVGFTITPARPGPVHARVQVLGGTSAEPVRRVTLSGSGPDGAAFAVGLRSASVDRFEGSTRIVRAGGWTLDAALTTDRGIVRVQATTPLPAPSGSADLDRAIQAQERLVSVRVAETLRSSQASPALDTIYEFHAPDTFAFSTGGGDDIDIGTRSYRRDAGSPRWSMSDTGFPFRWPAPYFEQLWGPGFAPRIVGSDVVDGVASHVVAFARPDLPAWFRIWVGDADGLVRREEMLAENHLMVHTYSDFDRVAPLMAPG